MPATDALGRLAPPLFVFMWATGFVVARLVAPHADPFTFLTLRFALAALILALLAFALGAPWPTTSRGWRDGLIAGVLLHGIYLGGVFWSVKHGLPAGVSALVAGLQPLVTGMLVGPLLGEHVSARRWLGIGIGFAGAAMVIAPRLSGIEAYPPLTLAASFLAVVGMTLGTIWQKRTAAKVDLRTNTAIQYVGAALVMAPLALLAEDLRLDPTPQLWFGLFWTVFGLSIAAVGLLMLLIRRGAVAGVAALLYLVPPTSAVMAYVIFGETLTPIQIVGMAVAAVGVAIANRG